QATSEFSGSSPTLIDVTSPGVILGTAQYMSPEQVRGSVVDFRSDQFSFGTVLYELLSGKPTFLRETAVQAMSAIIETKPDPISELNPNVPPDLERIIDRCLSKDPKSRYASTRDLLRELQDVRANWSEKKTL